MLGNEARRHALKRCPGGDHLDDFALRLAHDIDAASGYRADEPFALELRDRFAHRRAADAEFRRQLAFVKTDIRAVAVDVHRDDDVLERGVGLVLEARGVDWDNDGPGCNRRTIARDRACRGCGNRGLGSNLVYIFPEVNGGANKTLPTQVRGARLTTLPLA